MYYYSMKTLESVWEKPEALKNLDGKFKHFYFCTNITIKSQKNKEVNYGINYQNNGKIDKF